MNVTKDGFKDRQLHMEDYLQMVSAEQKEYAEVSVYQRITENNHIITDFWTDNQGWTSGIADTQIPECRSIAERILRENGGRRTTGRAVKSTVWERAAE